MEVSAERSFVAFQDSCDNSGLDNSKTNTYMREVPSSFEAEHFDILVSFCPDIIKIISNHASSQEIRGCALIVDVSGFTRLSSCLCDKGTVGLDNLRVVTNSLFDKLLPAIFSHGGDGN